MYDYLLEELLLEDTLLEKMTTDEKDENFLNNITARALKGGKLKGKDVTFNGAILGKNHYGALVKDNKNDKTYLAFTKYDKWNKSDIRKKRRFNNALNATGASIGAAGAALNIRGISKAKKQLKDLEDPKIARELYKKSNSNLSQKEWIDLRKKQLKKTMKIHALGTGFGAAATISGGVGLYRDNKKFKPVKLEEDIEFLIETVDIPYFDEF